MCADYAHKWRFNVGINVGILGVAFNNNLKITLLLTIVSRNDIGIFILSAM